MTVLRAIAFFILLVSLASHAPEAQAGVLNLQPVSPARRGPNELWLQQLHLQSQRQVRCLHAALLFVARTAALPAMGVLNPKTPI